MALALPIVAWPVFLDDETIHSTLIFIISFLLVLVLHTLLLSLFELDPLSAFSASVAAISNSGPAVGQFSHFDSYAALHPLCKTSMGVLMLIGRLEVYGLLMVILPTRR